MDHMDPSRLDTDRLSPPRSISSCEMKKKMALIIRCDIMILSSLKNKQVYHFSIVCQSFITVVE